RVRVVERSFDIPIDDKQLAKWFPSQPPYFRFRVYLNGELSLTTPSAVAWSNRKRKPIMIDLCARNTAPRCGKVCGTVTDCRGNPLPNMRVRIFDVDLYDATSFGDQGSSAVAGDQKPRDPRSIGTPLGETTTNACGEYCVCYEYRDYFKREIDTADI